MKLTNELLLAVPRAQSWSTLLDVPRVARALPGALVDPDPSDGAYRGTMKVKLGPVSTEYAGTVRLTDVDEDGGVLAFDVQGREIRGQGTASATITARLAPEAGGTRLIVDTDLEVTGRQAQFARGIMEDVAGAILTEFAARLEREIVGGPAAKTGEPGDALDVGVALYRPLLERAGILAVGVALGLSLGRAVWRR